MSKLSTLAKRLFSASLCAILALSTVPMEPIAAWAEDLAESQGGVEADASAEGSGASDEESAGVAGADESSAASGSNGDAGEAVGDESSAEATDGSTEPLVASEDESDGQAGGAASDSAASSATLTEGWTQFQDTCEYKLDDNGCLTLRPLGNGDYAEVSSLSSAWAHNQNVRSFRISNTICLAGDAVAMFSGCYGLKSVDFSGLVTPNAVDASCMFMNCSVLETVKLPESGFKVSNVSNMFYYSGLFSTASALSQLDLSGLETPEPVDASYMFFNNKNLKYVNLPASGFKVSNASDMFRACSGMLSQGLSGIVTEEPVDASRMFYGCSGILSASLPEGFKVSCASKMFSDCSALERADLSNLFTVNSIDASSLFTRCKALTTVHFPSSGFKVSNVSAMFSECKSLAEVDLSELMTAEAVDTSNMFYGCLSLSAASFPASGFKVSNLEFMFYSCAKLVTVDLAGLETTDTVSINRMFLDCSALESIALPCSAFKVSDVSYAFENCALLTRIDLSGFETPESVSAEGLFAGCSKLAVASLPSAGFKLSKIESGGYDTSRMFYGCSSLESIDLSGAVLSESANASRMFKDCKALKSVTLPSSGFKVSSMSYMFSGCSALTSASLLGLEVSDAIDASYAFNGCSLLASVILPSSDFKVSNVASMFSGCSSLELVDASGFVTSAAVNGSYMFRGCSSLTSVVLPSSGFLVSATTGMFYNCSKLTSLDLSVLDNTDERIDSSSSDNKMFYGMTLLSEVSVGKAFTFPGALSSAYGAKSVAIKWMDSSGAIFSADGMPSGVASTYKAYAGDISKSMFSVDLSDREYTGSEIKPDVTYIGTGSLTNGTDYVVSYANNVDTGKATVIVQGNGIYLGKLVYGFSITKASGGYELPTGLTATYGQTLADVALPEGFVWDDPSQSVGNVGDNEFGLSWVGDAYHEGATGLKVTVHVPLSPEAAIDFGELRDAAEDGAPTNVKNGMLADSSSVDYYLFKLERHSEVMLSFSSEGGGISYELLDSDGSPVANPIGEDIAGVTSGDIEGSDCGGLDAGTYYIRVSTSSADVSDKAYSVELYKKETKGYEVEPNDGLSSATDLGLLTDVREQTVYGNFAIGKISSSSDIDVFSFSFDGDSSLMLEVDADNGGIAYELLDADGNLVKNPGGAEISGVTSSDKGGCDCGVLPGGTYYLRLSASDSGASEKSYSVELRKKQVWDYEWPGSLSASYGQTLADVELPDGFTWDDPSQSVGEPGEHEFAASYSPAGSALSDAGVISVTVSALTVEASMFSVASDGLVYTGGELEPAVSSDVVPDGSYTVAYRDNVEAGTATAVITGSGYWTGSCELTFQISKAAASYELPTGLAAAYGQTLADVALPEGFAWDDPTLSVGDAGENGFGLSWAGDANHEGATGLTATVSVTRGVEGSMFSVASDGLAYTGGALEPAVSSDVVPDCSYTVTYRDNVDAGTAAAVIAGSGYWTGSCEVEFQIARAAASYELPTGLAATYGQTLADVALPEGFAWDDPTLSVGDAGENGFGLSWAGDANHEGATGLTATVRVTLPVEEGVDRIYGETRYETAGALVAEGSYASGGTVVIACGENFPDALSASSLAGDLGAPIVLTSQGYLPSATRERISELMPSKVYIMGGTAAVSPSVESEVRALSAPGCEVVRVAGVTRYDTNVEAVEALSGKSDTVIVACGTGFADALSISPYAYATSSPIVLCDSSALSDVAMAAISEGGYSHAIIVGGDHVVPSRVEGQLASLGVSDIRRLAGDTRYETSAEIVRFELSADVGITMDGITLASGENFPDALAAGPLSARRLAPLLLVDPSGDRAASFLSTYRGSVASASIVGGSAAVSESAARKISGALGVSLS